MCLYTAHSDRTTFSNDISRTSQILVGVFVTIKNKILNSIPSLGLMAIIMYLTIIDFDISEQGFLCTKG